jgi:hypothetical protein
VTDREQQHEQAINHWRQRAEQGHRTEENARQHIREERQEEDVDHPSELTRPRRGRKL